MLKRIAQEIVRKNRLDKINHALKFTDCDSELVQEEIKKFEEARPKTTFVVKQESGSWKWNTTLNKS